MIDRRSFTHYIYSTVTLRGDVMQGAYGRRQQYPDPYLFIRHVADIIGCTNFFPFRLRYPGPKTKDLIENGKIPAFIDSLLLALPSAAARG